MENLYKEWIRTCQECGNQQKDINPTEIKDNSVINRYYDRKCKKCKSISLDWGKFLSIEEQN